MAAGKAIFYFTDARNGQGSTQGLKISYSQTEIQLATQSTVIQAKFRTTAAKTIFYFTDPREGKSEYPKTKNRL